MNKNTKSKQGELADPLNYFSNNIVLISFDKDYAILSANASFQYLTGLSLVQLKVKNFREDFCKIMPDYTKDEICYLLERYKPWQGNFLLPTKSGTRAWFNSNIFPVDNEEGEFIGYTFLATLEKPQQDLISSQDTVESWMKAIFNDPEQVNILIGLSGEVIDFNVKAYHFMEWYGAQILDTDNLISDYFNVKFAKTFRALFDKAKNGQRQKFIRSFQNSTGYNKVVEIELRPVISQKNEIMGVIMVIIDISADVAMENRIKLSEQKLDQIAFINAHELRAPLASILGLVNLLDFGHVDKDSEVILNYLKKASNDLESVIQKVTQNTYTDNNIQGK